MRWPMLGTLPTERWLSRDLGGNIRRHVRLIWGVLYSVGGVGRSELAVNVRLGTVREP